MALTKTSKLIAVETYLQWTPKDFDEAIEVLDNIWYVVMEGRLKTADDTFESATYVR